MFYWTYTSNKSQINLTKNVQPRIENKTIDVLNSICLSKHRMMIKDSLINQNRNIKIGSSSKVEELDYTNIVIINYISYKQYF